MIISIHIPKTAGIAFRTALRAVFGDDIFLDYGTQFQFTDPYPKDLKAQYYHVKKLTKMRLRGHSTLRMTDKCIHGHFGGRKYDQIFPHGSKIVWVRDPVQRIASHYHYWQRHPDKASVVCNMLHEKDMSLLDFARLDVMRNYQSKFLQSSDLDDFLFVGVQEHFEKCLPLMMESIGVYIDTEVLDLNKNANPDQHGKGSYDLPVEIAREIRELNQLDTEFYEGSLKRLQRAGIEI